MLGTKIRCGGLVRVWRGLQRGGGCVEKPQEKGAGCVGLCVKRRRRRVQTVSWLGEGWGALKRQGT